MGHFIAAKIISVFNISHMALALCSFIAVYHRIINISTVSHGGPR